MRELSGPSLLATGGAAVLVLLTAVFVLAGGDRQERTVIIDELRSDGIAPAPCVRTNQKLAPATGLTVVLLDRSGSTHGSSAAPDYAHLVGPTIQDAAARGEVVVLSGFDGTSASLRWSFVPTAFSGNSNWASAATVDSVECIQSQISQILDEPAEQAGSDPLGAIAGATRVLASTPNRARRLVIVSDGLATKGCADLNTLPVGGRTDLVTEGCRASKEVVDPLDTPITWLGLGVSGTDQAPPQSSQLSWLTDLWSALCRQISGSECRITSQVSLTDSRPAARTAPPDPAIVWPDVKVRRPRSGILALNVEERLLFDMDSTILQGDANHALQAVEDEVRGVQGSITDIIGHADSTGSREYNQGLSLARAQTVADELEKRFGRTAARVRGVGSTDPECPRERTSDGGWNEVALQCNRRVEIVIQFTQQDNR